VESSLICSLDVWGAGSLGEELVHSVWRVLLMIPKPPTCGAWSVELDFGTRGKEGLILTR